MGSRLAIAAVLACSAIGTPQQPDSAVTAKKLIETMFKHYAGAESVKGVIKLHVVAGAESGDITTEVAYKTPNLVRVDQYGSYTTKKFIRCNGTQVAYNLPEASGGTPLLESAYKDGVGYSCRDIYHIGGPGLKDRNTPLDILFAAPTDLRYVVGQWATREYAGTLLDAGRTVYVVKGQYRDYPGIEPSGVYTLKVLEDGTLVEYGIKSNLKLANGKTGASTGVQTVESVWQVDAQTNVELANTTFVLGG